jgi:uncharacterized protein (UPF0276 family)
MTTVLTAGIGLKPEYYEAALACPAEGLWFEVHPENYLVSGGPRLGWLAAIRDVHPLSLHGVALSLAADAPPDHEHLARLAALAERVQPALISEHLAWSTWRGAYYPDLLPFARTHAALTRIAANISITQDALGRSIAIENPSHYVNIDGHDWAEIDFLTELARRTGCSLLLDVNNVHVSANNLGYSAEHYLDAFPGEAIAEIHLAGHTQDPNLGDALLVDSHDMPVAPEVWALYTRLISRIGPRPTLIERDANLPAFEELLSERDTAHAVMHACLMAETVKMTAAA